MDRSSGRWPLFRRLYSSLEFVLILLSLSLFAILHRIVHQRHSERLVNLTSTTSRETTLFQDVMDAKSAREYLAQP